MIDFSKCKTTKDYEQVLLDKLRTYKLGTQPLSATGCPIDILAKYLRKYKQRYTAGFSCLNVAVCATTKTKFRSVRDAMFPDVRIAVRSCTCVPVVCMTTRTTVAIGILKPNLAGGADANESKAF